MRKVIHLKGMLIDKLKVELEEPTSIVEESCYIRKSNIFSRTGLREE